MKSGEANPVDQVPHAGVLFADIVGFTELSSSLRPAELVRLLNDNFTEFDRLVADHGLEKIKTIGDAYMVAAGIPEQSPNSLERLADFAVDLRDLMKVRSSGSPLQLRIGLNAGPVVAGVIGSRKFLYDLWGETVNVASRMESHGVPGRIHLPACLCQQLSDRFTFTACDPIEVKGVGNDGDRISRRSARLGACNRTIGFFEFPLMSAPGSDTMAPSDGMRSGPVQRGPTIGALLSDGLGRIAGIAKTAQTNPAVAPQRDPGVGHCVVRQRYCLDQQARDLHGRYALRCEVRLAQGDRPRRWPSRRSHKIR